MHGSKWMEKDILHVKSCNFKLPSWHVWIGRHISFLCVWIYVYVLMYMPVEASRQSQESFLMCDPPMWATDVLTSVELALSCASQSVRNLRALPTSALPCWDTSVCYCSQIFLTWIQILMISRQVLYQCRHACSPSLMGFKHKRQEVQIVTCLFLWWF